MDKSRDTFIEVLDSHKGIIYKIVNSYCKDKDDRQDLVQEIIVQLWSSFHKFDERYKFSTWIYRIALNTSISFYRKNKVRQEETVEFPSIIEHKMEVEDTSSQSQELALLNTFIQELREIDKGLIIMYLDGLSSKEIAEVMGISPTNVTTKIGRIKDLLKKKFEHVNTQHHAG